MENILKINFNNAKIKLPTLSAPYIIWINNRIISIRHNNLENFDEVKMNIYINGEFKIDTYYDRLDYLIVDKEEDLLRGTSYEIKIELIGISSKLTKTYTLSKRIYNPLFCAEDLVCSESLICREGDNKYGL